MHFHPLSAKTGHAAKWVVVVADSVPSHRHAIAHVLTKAFERRISCENAGSYVDCAALVADRDVDLILLDLALLKARGLSAISRLRDGERNPAILLVARNCDPETLRIVMTQGAAGYLPQSASPATLIGAVRAVLEGGRFIPSEAADELAGKRPRLSAAPSHAPF